MLSASAVSENAMLENRTPVVALAGPTGSGKTALALELCRQIPCGIINADSRQMYSAFPVLSAQPSDAEKASAPHHLFGFLPLDQKYNAMSWARLAAEKAAAIYAQGKLPLLVGGTGFYFETILRGLSPMPSISPEISRQVASEMEEMGVSAMYSILRKTDPEYATQIHPHDRQRIARALEVYRASGKTFTWWRGLPACGGLVQGPLFVLDVQLDSLAPRLLERIDAMILDGAMEEVKEACKLWPDKHLPGWSCIGARECLEALEGKTDYNTMRKSWHLATRSYAKRQITWFRARENANFMAPGDFVGRVMKHARENPRLNKIL